MVTKRNRAKRHIALSNSKRVVAHYVCWRPTDNAIEVVIHPEAVEII